MKANEKTVFLEAIKKYGQEDQIQMVYEECSELIKALSKYHRVSKHQAYDKRKVQRCLNNIIEEVADVSIMIDQVKLIFGITEKQIAAIRDEKVSRLEDTLNREN